MTIVEGDPLDGLLLANWRDLVHLNFLSKIKINLHIHCNFELYLCMLLNSNHFANSVLGLYLMKEAQILMKTPFCKCSGFTKSSG